MATIFERDFELHHAVERHVSQCYEIMDPNGHGQWARSSPRVFILKELNAAECEGLACETSGTSLVYTRQYEISDFDHVFGLNSILIL